MAHNIDTSNGRDNIAYLGSRKDVWHRLGQEMKPGQSIDTWARGPGTIQNACTGFLLNLGDDQMTPNQKILADIKAAALPVAPPTPQPFFCEGSPAMVQLETMVDRVGIRNVLFALSSICDAKAEHLHSNWQDHVAARIWEGRAKRVAKTAGGMNE